MALEAVVFSQDLYSLFAGGLSFEYPQIPLDFPEKQTENPPLELESRTPNPVKPRKRRPKSRKNKQEIENQRMTHIAVERNRRKQMNEYLSVLRSLMPDSYIQRGDQASIVGGAINFVKELEQQVQFLSTDSSSCSSCSSSCSSSSQTHSSSIADIEVTMVENHANLKIRSKKRPKQVLKIVAGLQALFLSVLHLNISTMNQVVHYCLSVKVSLSYHCEESLFLTWYQSHALNLVMIIESSEVMSHER
ncbi:transcription factor bHLH94-like isoform X1 [Cucurbita pepo subsp. pepo]|uniref:transcription factor bHLH94-like isoform X1 n=1 Tax=Cucurbita pepo subsp. pepo TaxID=3664 RepID=UPI000C9D8D76|nr:transcription factor bHLH94-like isoform X1 [Cucurbita pepo subsp. pepo]